MEKKTKKPKLKQFHIETLDGNGSLNFFTLAINHKKALRRLETHSWDFKNLLKHNRDFTITVKQLT